MDNKQRFVSIIIVNYGGIELIKECLDSLLGIDYPRDKFEIIVVDNCPNPEPASFLRNKYKTIEVIKNKVNNYCQACNRGISKAKGDYLVLLNNDVTVKPNWLSKLVKVVDKDNSIGAVTSKLLRENGVIQNAGLYELPNFYWDERGAGKGKNEFNSVTDVDAISGACVLYRRAALRQIGFLDEDFVIFGEDVDMSLRLKAKGWRLVYVPGSLAYHKFHGSCDESFAREAIEKNRLLFIAKHFPEKLSSSLLGRGHFAINDKNLDSGRIFDLLPEILSKLFKEHSFEVSSRAAKDLLLEVKRITNYDTKQIEECLKNILKDLSETKKDRDQSKTDRELLEKDLISLREEFELRQKDLSETRKDRNRSRVDKELLEREIASLWEEFELRQKDLSETRKDRNRSRADKELLEREIAFLRQELELRQKDLFETTKDRDQFRVDKELLEREIVSLRQELENYKDEVNNLANRLRGSFDEGLIKDSVILSLSQNIKEYEEKLALSQQELELRQKDLFETTKDRDHFRVDKELLEREIVSLRQELENYKD